MYLTAAALLLTMILVPLGVLRAGRGLVTALDRLQTLTSPSASTSEDRASTRPGAPLAGLRVRVVDPTGAPLPGAAVRLVSPPPSLTLWGEALTDAAGGCAFPTEAGGHARVRVVASREGVGVVTSEEVAWPVTGSSEVDLVVDGRGSIAGTVVDARGRPVAGARLAVDDVPWADGATTGEDGRFTMTTVPHEATGLVAIARGFRKAHASLATRAAHAEGADDGDFTVHIVLTEGPPVLGNVVDSDGGPIAARVVACEGESGEAQATSNGEDGAFELPPSAIGCSVVATQREHAASAPLLAAEGARLKLQLRPGGGVDGLVVDGRGAPVTSFAVGIESFSGAHGNDMRNDRRQTIDDRGGAFTYDRLAPGTYVFTASAEGTPPTRSPPVDVASGSRSQVRIVLVAGGTVVGHVFDDKHAPLAGATLAFDQASSVVMSHAKAVTDASGSFTLAGAPAGPFSVRVESKGFRMRLMTGLSVDSGATLALDVTLSPASGGANIELGGIGATVERGARGVLLRSVFPGDPADRAGLRAGDLVLRIDGEPTDGMSLADALQRLRGEPGTSVGISVQRGDGEVVDALVVRAVVVH